MTVDPAARRCHRCDGNAIIECHVAGNRVEDLCAEHGYAGTWVTTRDRDERLNDLRARGMRPDAIAAGALHMIKRTRD